MPRTLCIVMPHGQRSLQQAIESENFVGKEFELVRLMAKQILNCLHYLHSCGVVHADVRLSCVRAHAAMQISVCTAQAAKHRAHWRAVAAHRLRRSPSCRWRCKLPLC